MRSLRRKSSHRDTEMNSQGKSIALFGATGLVGRECLRSLLDDRTFSRVLVLTRRPLSSKPDNSARLARLETHITRLFHLATLQT